MSETEVDYLGLLPKHVASPDPALYVQGRPIFIDFETTNKDNGSALNKDNRLVLACWQDAEGNRFHKFGSEYEQGELLEAIARADYIVAHNAKFELQWLVRCGLDLKTVVVYDTMLAEYVIGGNRYKMYQLGLDSCLQRRVLGGKDAVVSKMIKAGICPSDIPQEWLLRYCRQDVAVLPTLMRAQLRDMDGTRLLPVVYNRCLLTPVLADIEAEGMQLDAARVHEKYKEAKEKYDALEREMNLLAGGINPRSPKQVAAYLYDTLKFDELVVRRGRDWVPARTESGGRKADADTILALNARTAKQREFRDLYVVLAEWGHKLSKYLNKFEACVNEVGGVLYADFNQANTATHRLSSTGRAYSAQFQNFPRAYKPIFRARRAGHLIGEADGAQLEFRAAAHLGRDKQAMLDIENNVDVHEYTSSVLTNAGQPTNRQDAKTHTFKPLYGGQSGTDAEQTYYAAFRKKYPEITATQQRWIDTVVRDKKLETEWGLVYYWPDTRMDRTGYVRNRESICNYPVQGFATAEIIPMALIMMWHILKRTGWEIYLVNTVHDSIVAEIKPEAADQFRDLSRWALSVGVYQMVQRLYGIKLVCRLGCGVKVSENWGDTKQEAKYEAPRELYGS